ncbi:MAG: hypothetical protein Q4G46_00195 [Propionibacteriaceae bacterium]|nr:hypothetical protein [Propionibacteriaceae bacterium]
MKKIDWESVPCTHCGAAKGEMCDYRGYKQRGVTHASRVDAVLKIEREIRELI